jgi:hypothetical protein
VATFVDECDDAVAERETAGPGEGVEVGRSAGEISPQAKHTQNQSCNEECDGDLLLFSHGNKPIHMHAAIVRVLFVLLRPLGVPGLIVGDAVLIASVTASLCAAVILLIRNRTYKKIAEADAVDADGDGIPDAYTER